MRRWRAKDVVGLADENAHPFGCEWDLPDLPIPGAARHRIELRAARRPAIDEAVAIPGQYEAVATTIKAFDKLDVLVNNAAFQQHANDITDISDQHFDRTLKTNLYGYFYMARAAVPKMKSGGSIVMNGSVTGLLGSSHLLDYSMTKGGIHAFTRSLASSLIERGRSGRQECAPAFVCSGQRPAARATSPARFFHCPRRSALY